MLGIKTKYVPVTGDPGKRIVDTDNNSPLQSLTSAITKYSKKYPGISRNQWPIASAMQESKQQASEEGNVVFYVQFSNQPPTMASIVNMGINTYYGPDFIIPVGYNNAVEYNPKNQTWKIPFTWIS